MEARAFRMLNTGTTELHDQITYHHQLKGVVGTSCQLFEKRKDNIRYLEATLRLRSDLSVPFVLNGERAPETAAQLVKVDSKGQSWA